MKYKISARAIDELEDIIEAKDENEAYKILEEKLDKGEMPVVGIGYIEMKEVEEVGEIV